MRKIKTSNDLTLDNIKQAIRDEVNTIVKPLKSDIIGLSVSLNTLKNKVEEMDKKYGDRFEKAFMELDKVIGTGKKHNEQHDLNLIAHDRFQDDINILKRNPPRNLAYA